MHLRCGRITKSVLLKNLFIYFVGGAIFFLKKIQNEIRKGMSRKLEWIFNKNPLEFSRRSYSRTTREPTFKIHCAERF